MGSGQAALAHAVPVCLCHIQGTPPSICCVDSLCMELPFPLKTSDYLVYDPEKLWKDLEGKEKRERMMTFRGKIWSFIYKLVKCKGFSLKCQ